jgi:hypothetical protein
MEDTCPICHTKVNATHRVGGPVEEMPYEPQSERGHCEQGHHVGRWLDEYGRPFGPWLRVP